MEEYQPRRSSSIEGWERMAGSGQALTLPPSRSVPGPGGGVLGRGGAWCAPKRRPVPVPQVSGAVRVLRRAPKAPSRLTVFMMQVKYIHLE